MEWPEYPKEYGGRGVDGVLRGYTFPRLYTKPLRELTPHTSLGYMAIVFARMFGRHLHPWQEWWLIHSLELAEGSFTTDKYPRLRFATVLLLVARQNGKSYVMATRALWRMHMWEGPSDDPTLVLGAAHKLPAAEEIMDLALAAIRRSDRYSQFLHHAPRGTGQKSIVLSNGARYLCEAATDDGGRGKSVDDLLFDELRQQYDWSPWNALTNTTLARFSSQVIAVSNAGTYRSTVLKALRSTAIKHIDSGGDIFLADYSAPDGSPVMDEDGWAHANPSMGHPDTNGVVYVSEQSIRSKAEKVAQGGDEGIPESTFRTENLCQWVTLDTEGVWTSDQILACVDPDSAIDPESPITVGVDTTADRKWTYLAVAGWRSDGLPHVEVVAQRAHTEWVPRVVNEGLAFSPSAVVFQGRGAPASSLVSYVQEYPRDDWLDPLPVKLCQGSDLTTSVSQFSDWLTSGRLRYRPQPALELALSNVVMKRTGEVGIWDRYGSPVDVSPLCAVNLALWGLENQPAQRRSTAYGDSYGKWW